MIYIEVLNLWWNPAKEVGLTGVEAYVYNRRVANQFLKDIKVNISTEKFKYPPFTQRYLLYKVKRGYSLNKWEATYFLKNNLKVYRIGMFKLGIGWRGKRYKSGASVLSVAKKLEYGTMVIPPRPLFRDTFRTFKLPKKRPNFLVDKVRKVLWGR